MALPIPRFHFFEINDQSWFPATLRLQVQACLTLLWNLKIPPLQPATPSTLVARTLRSILAQSLPSYTFVDFCSGAGGPTPEIERAVNASFSETVKHGKEGGRGQSRDGINSIEKDAGGVEFVMTDIHPHLKAWEAAAKRSDHLHFVPVPVDAGNAPPDLLALTNTPHKSKKVFRLFSLAFHHFDDADAARILQNTLDTSSGFAIFELQQRTLGSLLTVIMIAPLLWLGSWYWFWGDWTHLFFTYVVPIVPVVVAFDGVVSSLRTRDAGEVLGLISGPEEGRRRREGWAFESGRVRHTWPGGEMSWVVGVKRE